MKRQILTTSASSADRRTRVRRLLRPASIAFIGGDEAARAIEQCRSLDFGGEIWPVNPVRPLVAGVRAFDSIAALPGPPEAAFVAVNRDTTVDVVRQLAEIGAGAVVCYASGFAETGGDGAAAQSELLEAAGGTPVVGPNCYGTISAVSGAVLWPDEQGLVTTDSGIAVVTQSGNIAVNLTMQQRSLRIAHVMTVGNQCDVGIEDCLDVLVDDPHTTGIAVHLEAIRDVGGFSDAATRAAARRIPIVALKTGWSDEGAAIAVTHTGSLVGDDAAYTALFERFGVRRVASVPELLDTLHVLHTIGPLPGARLTSLSCSGGEASLVADRARSHAVEFPAFEPDHADRIRSTLSDFVAMTNPLDYHTFIWSDEAALTKCFGAVLDGPFDAAMLVLDFPKPEIDRSRWWPTLRAFAAAVAATGTPGVVTSTMAETMPGEARARAGEMGLAVLNDVDSTLGSLAAAAWFGVERTMAPLWVLPSATGRTRTLDEDEAKELLRAGGIAVPDGEVVPVSDAATAARRIGYPVVIKATGLAHKSDVGAVRTGLMDPHAVEAAAMEISADVARASGGDESGLPGSVLVERQVVGAAELLVDVRRADPIGYLLTLGLGGSRVELLRDTRSLLLPVDPRSVRDALEDLAGWALLSGYRGAPAGAVDAVIDMVLEVAELARSRPEIIEIELNPVIATSDGAIAVDALMTLEAR